MAAVGVDAIILIDTELNNTADDIDIASVIQGSGTSSVSLTEVSTTDHSGRGIYLTVGASATTTVAAVLVAVSHVLVTVTV